MAVVLSKAGFGNYLLSADNGDSVIIQSDWDRPCVASFLGFVPCDCGETDGTVACRHKTTSEMISEATDFLDEHIGECFEDPGYFE